MNPELIQLAKLVADMRKAQKRFFDGDRSAAQVRICKDYERRVDRAVGEIVNPPTPGLFESNGGIGE